MKILKKIMIALVSGLLISNACATVNKVLPADNDHLNDNKNQTHPKYDMKEALPELDLTPYQKELESIKKLQREKVRLQLKKENEELTKALGGIGENDSEDLIKKIQVLDVIKIKKKSLARLYVPNRGVVLAKVGDKLNNSISLFEIKKNKVRAVIQSAETKKIEDLSFYYGNN